MSDLPGQLSCSGTEIFQTSALIRYRQRLWDEVDDQIRVGIPQDQVAIDESG